MRLSFAENPVRAMYAACLGLGVVLAYLAGAWGRWAELPWLLGGFVVLVLLTLLPWLSEGELPDLSYTAALNVIADTERASETYRIVARLVVLLLVPVLLGMMAMFRPTTLDFWFYGYLAIFAILGALGQNQQEGLLTNLMAGFGFLFLASLRHGPVNLVVGALAAALLLHAVAAYLLMLNYPDDGNPAGWLIVRVSSLRNLGVFALAGLFALGGTIVLHNLWDIIYTWFGLGDPLPDAGEGPSWLSGGGLLRLILYLLFSILTVFLIVKLVAVILRQRRSLKAGRLPRILEQASDPGGERIDYAVQGDWQGYRRQIISTYLKTRAALGKLGYDVRISTTPEDYTTYLGRRIREAYDPMWRLTDLFLTARYSGTDLDAQDPVRARELQQDVLRAVKSSRG